MLFASLKPPTNLSNCSNAIETNEIDSNNQRPIDSTLIDSNGRNNASDVKSISLDDSKQCGKPNAIVRPVVRKAEPNNTMTLPQSIEPHAIPTCKPQKRRINRSTGTIDSKSKSIAKDPTKTMPKNVIHYPSMNGVCCTFFDNLFVALHHTYYI